MITINGYYENQIFVKFSIMKKIKNHIIILPGISTFVTTTSMSTSGSHWNWQWNRCIRSQAFIASSRVGWFPHCIWFGYCFPNRSSSSTQPPSRANFWDIWKVASSFGSSSHTSWGVLIVLNWSRSLHHCPSSILSLSFFFVMLRKFNRKLDE